MSPSGGATSERKQALRREIVGRRDALDPRIREAYSRAICRRVAESPEFRAAPTVLLFASFGSEVDTGALLQAAFAAGKRVVLPRVNRETRALELREVRNLTQDLTPGTWGIPEPDAELCPEAQLADVDFVLIPGVAFDRQLRRVGYGGGYYDRLLGSLAPGTPAIAVGFGVQLVPEAPVDGHDLPVPVLITENERIDRP